MNIRCILLDIEGTTTDINFVHKVLFPYSEENMAAFLEVHGYSVEVQEALQVVRKTIQKEEDRLITYEEAGQVLRRWIAEDRKHTALKTIQGFIWKAGYEQNEFRSHIYTDVPDALFRWAALNITMAIYSSGSVEAQKLLFRHTVYGDLTGYFSHYFDTTVGGKKEAVSYLEISKRLGLKPSAMLFLSDIAAELDAAAETGLQTIQLNRDNGAEVTERHRVVESFDQIDPVFFPQMV